MKIDVINDIGWWIFSIALLVLSIYVATESLLAAPIVLLAVLLSNPYFNFHIKEKIIFIGSLNFKIVGVWCCLLASTLVMTAHMSAVAKEKQAILQEKARIAEQQAASFATQQKLEQENAERKRLEQIRDEFERDKVTILEKMDIATAKMDVDVASELVYKYSFLNDVEFSSKAAAYTTLRDRQRTKEREEQLKEKNKQWAAEAEAKNKENYKAHIRNYALDPYTPDQYPKLIAKYKTRLKEIEIMRRRAAEMAIDSGKCDYVETVEISDSKSSLRDVRLFVDCTNQQRFYLSENEIKNSSPARAESEKAWSTDSARTACRELIKDNATIPSSVDIHVFGSDVYRSQADGRVVITFNFDAKNEYGAEVGYVANCYFEPQRAGTIEISLRR